MMNKLKNFFKNHTDDYAQYYRNEFPRFYRESRPYSWWMTACGGASDGQYEGK